MKKLFLLLTVAMLSACTSSVHMSQVDVGSNSANELELGKVIEIEKSQKNILGFVYDTNYVDQAYKNLLLDCPNGTSMVNVEYLTNHGFLSWTDKIRIKAICL
ncbi:hypothetical protein A9Q75_08920 [Colwellia psychrerythraea]|mgnify:FL=1|uniref:Lipoprotein n=1 Tax=Colwellia psychrerythraea TaxID=28229 RepID=A0A1Y5EHS7_COLPS|nr:hypothetical protein A9Q75_08920 [Colwellia psychrerythraea]